MSTVARRFTVVGWSHTFKPVPLKDEEGKQVVDLEGRPLSTEVLVSPTFFTVDLHTLSMDGVKNSLGTATVEIDTADDLTGENFIAIRDRLIQRGLLASSGVSAALGGNDMLTEEEILSQERAARWEVVVGIRDGLETKGFPYLDKWFDSDERSVARINTTAQAAMAAAMLGQDFSTDWVCADNSVINLTRDQIIGMPVAFAMYCSTLHEKARSLRERIAAATGVLEVRACIWEGVETAAPAV